MKKMPMALAAIIPPITVVPMIWRPRAPALDAVHSGTHPRINANDVIRIGRRRSRAPLRAASTRLTPLSYLSLAYSPIRFVFFFQAEDGIRDIGVTGVQTCALPI